MSKTLLTTLILIIFQLSAFSQIEKITGHWKTIDDKDGTEKSVVFIFKATNGKYYGKIEKLFKDSARLCTECEGKNHNKPITGLLIINNMSLRNDVLTGGTILDPATGKIYNCHISYNVATGKLTVRGSLDKKGWIGRSQIWSKYSVSE